MGIRRTLVAVALAGVGTAYALAGPRLVVESEAIDLGTAVRGEELSARFVLRNTGDEVLRVLRAKPS